ncbi:hypothetical protein NBRC10512_005070 [Rhodotorula toruloides]|uniref:RHTO0S06e01112g1_1 n=2 Tax=Rhodotorula toruloides TaxID=5286 RepID=A0A061AUU4_RHOTO|nr:MFS transporter, Sugar transporter [Rhodotorula toruloides NP11]EMS24042.1 MFS transporter, Sugar transporter [Rhodotorula toruloides NP11]CDR41360.1 RHTO0S06e01112g1_1 [Rhodotorula toruloides]
MSKAHIQHLEHQMAATDAHEKGGRLAVANGAQHDPNEQTTISPRAWVVIALCALALLQNTFFSIAPAVCAYAIATPLGATAGQRIWIVNGPGIPSVVAGPIMGIFSDIYGRRYVVIFAFLIYCIASILAMTASGINGVIAGQVLGGIGYGVPGLIYAIPSEIVPAVWRAWVQTGLNFSASVGGIVALMGMGAATKADPINGWRWVFRTLLIMDGLLLLGFTAFYHPPPRTETRATWLEKVKSLDWIGYFLLVAGLAPLLMGFSWSADPDKGWHDPHSYACVAVGFAGLVACLLWEWTGTSRGFLDHRLFEQGRNFPLSCFVIAVEGALFFLTNNIYSAEVNGLWTTPGTLTANAHLLPFYCALFVIAPVMAWYVTKHKDVKWPLCAAFLCFSAAIIGFAMSGTNGKMALGFNAVAGVGFSVILILVTVVVQLSTPPLLIAAATSVTIVIRTIGGNVGYAIAAAIYGSLSNTQIPENILKAVIPLGFNPQYVGQLIGFLMSGQGLEAIPGVSGPILGAASAALKETEAHAYKITWFSFLPGAIIAAVGCALFKNPKERMNWLVDAPLEVKPAGRDNEAGVDTDSVLQEKM